MAKDLFSTQADLYARYRPVYPPELYNYILSFVKERELAWDCATGNGQAAAQLAQHFKKVIATDISAEQIARAAGAANIEYRVCSAESSVLPGNSTDLITVAQAYHWFDWKKFHAEVMRVARNGSVIAIWTYKRKTTDDKVDALVSSFYKNVTGPYWDEERKYVDDLYETVEFEYAPLPGKMFESVLDWQRSDLIGYISSWSAVQKFIRLQGYSPLPELEETLKGLWPDGQVKKTIFPISLRLGRVIK